MTSSDTVADRPRPIRPTPCAGLAQRVVTAR